MLMGAAQKHMASDSGGRVEISYILTVEARLKSLKLS